MSNLNVLTVKALLSKKFYDDNIAYVDKNSFTEEFREVIKALESAHANSNAETITIKQLWEVYKLESTATSTRRSNVKEFLGKVGKTKAPDEKLLQHILDQNYVRGVMRTIADISTEAMLNGTTSIEELKDKIEDMVQKRKENDTIFIPTTIDSIQEYVEEGSDFEFSNGLEFLQEFIPCPGRGEFIVVFAVSNVGKSTFASQCSTGFLQQGKKVLYLCNEEPGRKILLSHMRAGLRATEKDIENQSINKDKWDDMRANLYIHPSHGETFKDVKKLVKDVKPDVLIVDQADKISVSKKDDRHDLLLDKLYSDLRELAALHNMLVLGVTQSNAAGAGKIALTQFDTANAKIGKCTNADLVLGIGAQETASDLRFINVCKSKKGIEGYIGCKLHKELGRYEKV